MPSRSSTRRARGDFWFCGADLHVLEVLAVAGGLAILNVHHPRAMIEQERVQHELELAGEIQKGLLPNFVGETLPVFRVNIPVRQVSGDFYDVIRLSDDYLWFVLGDVSGKGMNAALLMAKTASVFRCLAETIDWPGTLMARINNELCETSSCGMFVTMIVGLLNLSEGRVLLTNA
ncbi:MAG: sigma-B regulation protein RsbU (phosphoserine phosphatase) [Rhodospirillaceae bacterium]|nr:MAG: sigma-B regulation protein RsbU (phosphoserine phosphatase) [Rhodospirillaceae bacterium]